MVFGPEPTAEACVVLLAVTGVFWLFASVPTAVLVSVVGCAIGSNDVAFLLLRVINTAVATSIQGARVLLRRNQKS